MAYIGNDPSNRFVASKSASVFSGDGSTTAFTLDHSVGSDEDILVSVDGVIQEPSVAYSVSGTTLTFTAAPSTNSGNNIFVYYLFRTVGTVSHPSSNALEATSGTFTGDLTIPDKIIHDGDTNTAIRFPSADTVSFETGGSERARVDSSGNLLVGTTNSSVESSSTDEGVNIFANKIGVARDGGVTANFNRLTSNGDIIKFRKDGTTVGTIGNSSNGSDFFKVIGSQNYFDTGVGNTGLRYYEGLRVIYPLDTDTSGGVDNAIDLGLSNARFDDIYATNGTIQTSDRNEKQDIEELSEAEQRVAVVAKGLMRKFRWKDAVAEKGDNARTHFGIIAQDLQDAFTAEGLDAGDYAMFTSTTWWEKEISVDAVEADEENGIEAKDAYTYMDTKEEATEGYTERTRLGVRYNQLLAFIISAL